MPYCKYIELKEKTLRLRIYVVIGGFSLLVDALLRGSSVCLIILPVLTMTDSVQIENKNALVSCSTQPRVFFINGMISIISKISKICFNPVICASGLQHLLQSYQYLLPRDPHLQLYPCT